MKTLALHPPPLRPLPRLRLATAALILVAALVGALILHGHRVAHVYPRCTAGFGFGIYPCVVQRRPGWVEPTTLGIALLGLAGAAGVLVAPRRSNR
jgi:hypothetical protein